jgi:DNA excision repair protein ERCC-5
MSGEHDPDTSYRPDTLTMMHAPQSRPDPPNAIASTSGLPIVISDSDSKPVSRLPSPGVEAFTPSRSPSPHVEDWDAAQEIDPVAEEGDFAEFVSKVKGKDIDDARREIDDEIKLLNHQKKLALRDSEEITQQMVAQIMVRVSFTVTTPRWLLVEPSFR